MENELLKNACFKIYFFNKIMKDKIGNVPFTKDRTKNAL